SSSGIALRPTIEDCTALVSHVHPNQDVTFRTDFEPVSNVAIGGGEMQQVIVNLMVNAVQAMDGIGQISIAVREQRRNTHKGVELTVADTGPGINADHINHIFDPFHTTKLGEGSGLGLSISQTLIRQAGGVMSAENRPTGGALFRIWLPEAQTE
ncbi:MAG: ATP-binding protein, partial [Pseudoruegeria sp.]